MADLRRICIGLLSDPNVRSYIASGNLLFTADGPPARHAQVIRDGIAAAFGFDVRVLVLPEAEIRAVLDGCPFPRDAGNKVHAFLCFDIPQLDYAGVDALKAGTEAVTVVDRTVWLHAPDGMGRSKLAEKLDRLIGVEVTARNLNTMQKMVAMLDEARG
ncbi:DUF1697 domain-containing protein [Loktanella agnita]|uniref:DUF1697 domain-containing protein n=1 Tax=Loktanella agnita TaxID=287097 RepID=UPI0039888AE5